MKLQGEYSVSVPYDQRIARILVRPLAHSFVTPNHITALVLALSLGAGGLFASGDPAAANLAAFMFVLARFLDHFDGELARLNGTASRFGYYFDYASGALGFAALFTGMGIGLSTGPLGQWAYIFGFCGAAAAIICLFLNLARDRREIAAEQADNRDADSVGYPALGGFELEDGIYLLAPITWMGWSAPFLVAAGIGAMVYFGWTLWKLRSAGAKKRGGL